MVCIYCGYDTRVINSRLQARSNQIWRRRQCESCKNIFSSLEGVNWEQAVRFKRKGRIEPFSRDKLFLSVYEACRHRKTAITDSSGLTTTILGKLRPQIESAALERDQVVRVTSGVLKRFNRAAQVQYLAYHPIKD